MQEGPGRLLQVLGHDKGFLVAIELSSYVLRHGSLCRDIVLK